MYTLMRYLAPILVLASALVLVEGCSHERHIIYRSSSPDGSAEIQLATFSRFPAQPNNVAELQLSTNRGKQVIRTWESSAFDMDPCFVAAAWTRDSGTVIALFRDCSRQSDLVAFDVRSHKTIDATEMKSALAEQIRSQYALPKSISDPIAWASESDKARRLFAEARSR